MYINGSFYPYTKNFKLVRGGDYGTEVNFF